MTEAPQVEGERGTRSRLVPTGDIKIIPREQIDQAISILRKILQERDAAP